MADGDLRKDVKELSKQVEALREALADLTEPYREIAGYVEQLQGISEDTSASWTSTRSTAPCRRTSWFPGSRTTSPRPS